jgi:hypothetical protein
MGMMDEHGLIKTLHPRSNSLTELYKRMEDVKRVECGSTFIPSLGAKLEVLDRVSHDEFDWMQFVVSL